MIVQNSFIAHFAKRETVLRWLCFTFGYFLLFSFLESPVICTISEIGRHHNYLFIIFCLIYSFSMVINLFYLKRNFGLKNKFFYYLSVFMSSAFGFVATTLLPDKSIGEITLFSTIAHWFFGFGGILINTVCTLVFLLQFMKEKKSKALKWIFSLLTGAGVLDLLTFAGATLLAGGNVQKSKNGFLEIVPMTVTFMVLFVINHTDLVKNRKERDKKEEAFIIRDNSLLSSISFASLLVSFVFFTLFAFVRNPIHFTISMTGVDYPVLFGFVCVSLAAAFLLNFVQMLRKSGTKNVILWFLAVIGPLSIIVCAASPTKLGTELDLVHSVAALIFFYFILAAFLFYYLSQIRDRKRRPFLFGTIGVLLGTSLALVLLFVVFQQRYGRTGLTEFIPIEYFFFCFLLENHTEYFTQKKTVSAVH